MKSETLRQGWRIRCRPKAYHRVLDAGDDPHRPTAARAGLHVDVEHPFQALGLRLIEARRSAGVRASGSPVAARRPPLPRLARVTRARYRLLGVSSQIAVLGIPLQQALTFQETADALFTTTQQRVLALLFEPNRRGPKAPVAKLLLASSAG